MRMLGRSARFALVGWLLAGTASPVFAQGATPSLTARISGIDTPAAAGRKLQIERLDVAVRIHGAVAETTVTARFVNNDRQVLEGDFRLMMPAGSVVTGYALDINGEMVDGVLVDQRQGRIAYEARVRQRIDPGLAEVSRDNLFRTRVFPIPPSGGRTITLRFTSPVDPVGGYVLPFSEASQVGTFNLAIEADGVAEAPQVRFAAAPDLGWTRRGNG